MANHLTPDELSDALGLERAEIMELCDKTAVPIYQGRIDKTLFMTAVAAAGHTLPGGGGVLTDAAPRGA